MPSYNNNIKCVSSTKTSFYGQNIIYMYGGSLCGVEDRRYSMNFLNTVYSFCGVLFLIFESSHEYTDRMKIIIINIVSRIIIQLNFHLHILLYMY